jgi:hypothetical protein
MRWPTQTERDHCQLPVCQISNNHGKKIKSELGKLKTNPHVKKGKNDSARVMHTV